MKKNVFKISTYTGIATLAFVMANTALAEESFKKHSLFTRISATAQQIGITPEEYLKAAHIMERLEDDDKSNDDFEYQRLDSFPEFHEAVSYAQSETPAPAHLKQRLVEIVNQQKMTLAVGLGLNLSVLEKFLSIYGSQHFAAVQSSKQNSSNRAGSAEPIITNKVEAQETIQVVCSDPCGGVSSGDFTTILMITDYAQVNYEPYESFEVTFVNRSRTKVVRREEWKYNSIFGAWKHGDLMCEGCENSDL